MQSTTKTVSSVLNSLIETCRDGQEGFRSAAEDVKNPTLKNLFEDYSRERASFVTELQTLVESLGESPEDSGSIAAAVHRGWIDLKSAIAEGDEHAVLVECERGEDSAVSEYREALAHEELPQNVREVVSRQYTSVQMAHDRVRDLRDSWEE